MDQNQPTGESQVSTVAQGADASQACRNLAQVSTPVPTNVFTGTIQGTLGFGTAQVGFLVEDLYDTQEAVMYWIFTKIK